MIYGIPPDDELGAPRRRRKKKAATAKKKGGARRRKAARKPGTGTGRSVKGPSGAEKYGGDCVPNTQGWEPCMAAWGRSAAGKRYREQQAERQRKERERRTAARRERGVVGCELENGKSMPCLPGMEPGVYSYANYRAAQAKLTGGQRALMARARALGFQSLAGMLSAGRSNRVSPEAGPYVETFNQAFPPGAWEHIAAGTAQNIALPGFSQNPRDRHSLSKYVYPRMCGPGTGGWKPGCIREQDHVPQLYIVLFSATPRRWQPFISYTSGGPLWRSPQTGLLGAERVSSAAVPLPVMWWGEGKKLKTLGSYPAVPTPGLLRDNKMVPAFNERGGEYGAGDFRHAGRLSLMSGEEASMALQARIYTGYHRKRAGGRGPIFQQIAPWKGGQVVGGYTIASVYQRYFSALPGGLIWDARRSDDATMSTRDKVETVAKDVPTTQGERVGAFRFEPLGRASFFGSGSHQIIAHQPGRDPAAPSGGERRIYAKRGDLPPQALQPYVSADLEGYFLKAPIAAVEKLRWYRVGPGTLETRISPGEFLLRDGARKVHPEVRKVQQRAGHWKYDGKSIGFSVTPILTADGKKFLYIEMFIGAKNAKTTQEGIPLDIFSGKPLSMIRVGGIPTAETVDTDAGERGKTFDRKNQWQFADNAAKVTVNMVAGMPYVILPRSSTGGNPAHPFPKPGTAAYLWSSGVGLAGHALGIAPGFRDQLTAVGRTQYGDPQETMLRRAMAAAQKRYEDLKGGTRQVHNTLQRLVGRPAKKKAGARRERPAKKKARAKLRKVRKKAPIRKDKK